MAFVQFHLMSEPFWEANMQKYSLHKLIITLVITTLAVTSFVVSSANKFAAPATEQLRAREVTGTLPGGQFAQIWLALEPETSGAQVSLVAEWDRNDPANQGLNFFILDDQGVRRVGEDSLSTIAIGAGSANFVLNGPDTVIGASFNAIGLATYTVVVSNESSQDANFTLRATNAFILDDSGQVTDPNATPTADAEEDATEETGDDAAATDDATTDDATADDATADDATTDTTTAVTTTVATTTTSTVDESVEIAPTATPASTSAVAGTARANLLSGSLPGQSKQHFLGLEPEGRDAQVTLRLTIEPSDSSELARRLNFWVLDSNGFTQFLGGTDPSDIAIAAGNRVFRGLENERVASFRVVGSGTYTVIVYNNATIDGSYELTIDGGVLVDEAGQTNESQASTLSATDTVTGTTTTTNTTTVDDSASTDTTDTDTTDTDTTDTDTTTTVSTRTGTPGGTYTIQSGDTLALVARDIYGDLNLYDEICAFNNIADCNVIEVGDVIQLPTQDEIGSGAQATVTATPAPTTAPATATADDETATAESDSTTAETPTLTATETTTDTTDTAESDSTDANTDTSTDNSDAATDTVYATLVSNGNFTTLVKGLDQAGLDSVLDGDGEYTLFAPTDAAFVALRNRFSLTEAQLLGLPELTDTMRYHVLSGSILSGDLTDGMTASSLQGKAVRFEVDGDAVKINGANIIAADVATANGVIHVIDAVIIPPAE